MEQPKSRKVNIRLQWWRKLVLPRRGKKDSLLSPAPLTTAQKLKLEERQASLQKAVQAPRVTRQKHLARAEWDRTRHEAVVTVARGNAMHSMGYFSQGNHYLYPEEALFLVDRGSMDLCINGLPCSVQRAWATIMSAPNSLSLNEYLVFAHLRRAGYVVRRYDAAEYGTQNGLDISFSVWRVGSFKRKECSRPLFHLAVFHCEEAPPTISTVGSALEDIGKTRLKFALIDRGVVVLTDVASNATPLSERYVKRLAKKEQVFARQLESGICEQLFEEVNSNEDTKE
ncbi:tRNA-splicing endonuclease subunit Sen54 [Gracilaria domingensis]|nr:tRNA-splicing endonuclease subunit Sen54 [Gracilaria domingensis]